MNAPAPRPAECLVCPHPAERHDETGCRPEVGMCACAVKRSQLRPPPAPAPLEVADDVDTADTADTPGDTADTDAPGDDVVLEERIEPARVCLECGHPEPHDQQRGQCRRCSCDGPRWGTPSELAAQDAASSSGDDDEVLAAAGADPDFESAPAGGPAEPGGTAPLEARGGTARNYDWPSIKRRYVEGVKSQGEEATVWPSLNEVANHFGVTGSRVREKAAQDGWAEQRRQWQAYMERTRQQARAAALAKSGVELDNHAIDVSKVGLQLLNALVVDRARAVQLARQGSTDGVGTTSALSALELQRIASAADLFHKIGLRAVGDPEVRAADITNAAGRPIEISQELRRDDPDRMATVLAVLQQAGMGELFGGVGGDVGRGAPALERAPDGSYPPPVAR